MSKRIRIIAILTIVAVGALCVGYIWAERDCSARRFPVFIDARQYPDFSRVRNAFGDPKEQLTLTASKLLEPSTADRFGLNRRALAGALRSVERGEASTDVRVVVGVWSSRCHYPFDGGRLVVVAREADMRVFYLSTQFSWT